MANFLGELDAIYCLCMEPRKNFVINQFTNLGYMHKIKIIKAFVPEDPICKETINNHLVYPVYTNNLFHIVCTLGLVKILEDIVVNKYDYVMFIEDDVIFLDKMFEFANQWINKSVISKHFDITKPYTLYLQSSKSEESYKTTNKGINKCHVDYGEPASIFNYKLAELLLKHIYPITAPFDDFKIALRKKYKVQEGLLIPYVCRELSKNYYRYDVKELGCQFIRSVDVKRNDSIFSILAKSTFYIAPSVNDMYQRMALYLIHLINPQIKLVLGAPPGGIRSYSVGNVLDSGLNVVPGYIFSCTLADTLLEKKNCFLISVRGNKSGAIAKKKWGINPVVGEFLWLFSRFCKMKLNTKRIYCFLFKASFKINCDEQFEIINPLSVDIPLLLNNICSSEYVITDDLSLIAVAHSYGVKAVLATLDGKLDGKSMIEDYYSGVNNFNPLNLNCKDNLVIINDNLKLQIRNFFQINPSSKCVEENISVCPFILSQHLLFRNKRFLTAIQ